MNTILSNILPKYKSPFRLMVSSLFVLVSLWYSQCYAQTSQMELFAVANESGAPEQMTLENLVRALRGQKIKWEDGSPVIVALMKPKTASGTVISRRVFNMTPDNVSKYWLAMVFQGRIRAAKFFNQESDLINYVIQTKGAIGVIPSKNQKGSNIRVINVDGSEYL